MSSYYATLQRHIMPSQKYKDDDLVPKDALQRSAKYTKGSEQHPDISKPNDLPPQDPLIISNDLECRISQLLSSIDITYLIKLFKLFFTDKWLREITQCTNTNTVRI